jgi:CRISPR-associated protein Cas2
MEHFYLVAYDIGNSRRWRKVYKTMKGFGEWMQLSVFQCRLDKVKHLHMSDALSEIIDHEEDHVLIIDIGPAESIKPKVTSMGRPFDPIERKALIV